MKQVFIASDHTGISLAENVTSFVKSLNLNPVLISFTSNEDYTDIAKNISTKVAYTENSFGILICGSGVGVSIVANRFKNIRAALCHTSQIAELSRLHNNANILCLGARIVEEKIQFEIIKTFFETNFEGGRHEIRINKIDL